MPDTGERREITRRVNAREAEMVQESKKLVSKTREFSAAANMKNQARSVDAKKARPGKNTNKK